MQLRHLFALTLLPLALTPTYADTFGTGENQFEIEFVTIGDPSNAADTTGEPNPAGSVPYVYRIGKYEIPEHAIRRANAASADSANPLNITLDERGPDKPATRVSWFEAARFVNWLNADKGAPPAYKFDDDPGGSGDFQLWQPGDVGYNPANPFSNTRARYFLPSVDEWYKAAFYDPATDTWYDYPNGMNTPPMPVAGGTEPNTAVYNQAGPADVMLAGGESPFGTVGQAGNMLEWDETSFDLLNDSTGEQRGIRGFGFNFTSTTLDLSSEYRTRGFPGANLTNVGFRVVSVPEPKSLALSLYALATFAASRWRRQTLRLLLLSLALRSLPSPATATSRRVGA